MLDPNLSLRVVLSKFCLSRDLDLSSIVPRNVETGDAISLSTNLGDIPGCAVYLETSMDKGLGKLHCMITNRTSGDTRGGRKARRSKEGGVAK